MELQINLYADWIETVKYIFESSGQPLPPDLSDEETSFQYFRQNTSTDEEADELSQSNTARFEQLQQAITDNLETIILPDIRKRTNYQSDKLHFRWMYAENAEHIVELHSEYRIPLTQPPS